MAITEHRSPTQPSVHVKGTTATVRPFDQPTADELASTFGVLLDEGVRCIELDLTDVASVDHVVVELVATVHARMCGRAGHVRVTGASPLVGDALRRRGLAGLLGHREWASQSR